MSDSLTNKAGESDWVPGFSAARAGGPWEAVAPRGGQSRGRHRGMESQRLFLMDSDESIWGGLVFTKEVSAWIVKFYIK